MAETACDCHPEGGDSHGIERFLEVDIVGCCTHVESSRCDAGTMSVAWYLDASIAVDVDFGHPKSRRSIFDGTTGEDIRALHQKASIVEKSIVCNVTCAGHVPSH